MVKTVWTYVLGCLSHAWRGSINNALNWASVIGIGVVGAYREHWGSPMSAPHTWQGIVGWTLIYTAVAWIIIFAIRFILVAPFRLYYEQKTRADKLEGLKELANDASKPPSFDIGFDYSPYDEKRDYLVDHFSILRIWVENLENRHVEGCQVVVENFGPDSVIRKGSMLFHDVRGNDEKVTRFDLAPTERKFFRFIDIDKDTVYVEYAHSRSLSFKDSMRSRGYWHDEFF